MGFRGAIFCLAVFLLVSCGGPEWDDTVVVNSSGLSVEFRFSHTGEITLTPGDRTSFGTRAHQRLEWFRYDGQESPGDPALVRFVYVTTNRGASGEFRLVCVCAGDDCDTCVCGDVARTECDGFCGCDRDAAPDGD